MSNKDFKTVEPPTSGHPKGEDLVVAYESRTTGGLFRVEVQTFLVFGREFIACNFSTLSKFSCTLCSLVHRVQHTKTYNLTLERKGYWKDVTLEG